jgi:tRNA-specific 2-thiouridylase
MSGGVDSSVAAAILKESGYDVTGIGLLLVDPPDSEGGAACHRGIEAMEDANRVAERLSIPFLVFDFRDIFKRTVIDYFTSSYLRGETPNPCVRCNAAIKFGELLRVAEDMGSGYVATGHYARVDADASTGRHILKKGLDSSKDQSYFLYSLSQEQLARTLFPLGGMTKAETRDVAKRLGLQVHDKPESQDICFTGGESYASFVCRRSRAEVEPGNIFDESGRVIGTHRGLPYYTIGQRRGLGVSFEDRVYVVDMNADDNSITVASAESLRRQSRLIIAGVNYVSIGPPEQRIELMAKTRYKRAEVPATFEALGGGKAAVEFSRPQEPTAPGQSVVLYSGDMVVSGGVAVRTASTAEMI